MSTPSQTNTKKEIAFSHLFSAVGFGVIVYFSHYKEEDEFFASASSAFFYALIIWIIISSYRPPKNTRFTILAKITHLLAVIGIVFTGLSHLFSDVAMLGLYAALGALAMTVVSGVLCSIPAAKAP